MYRRLPDQIMDLLVENTASPRLIAHLTLVYDVAWEITDMLIKQFPKLLFNQNEVLYGAGIHDIGKIVVPSELSVSGTLHEEAGYQLLCNQGIPKQLALFARDHSKWNTNSTIENLLVSVSDKIWKGKRIPGLEELILHKILKDEQEEKWSAFFALDEILEQVALDSDRRLVYQSSYPISV